MERDKHGQSSKNPRIRDCFPETSENMSAEPPQRLAVPPFSVGIEPNWQQLLSCILRKNTPDRVHFFETHIDMEVRQEIAARYGLLAEDVGPTDPYYDEKLHLAVQRFLGYDYVRGIPEGVRISFDRAKATDTAPMQRHGGTRLVREANRPYLCHCCGKIESIMEYAIEDVGIAAKHSFEDVIESVVDAKAKYGDRIALLGGIDVDFLCNSSEEEIRDRVRSTLEQCIPGGGYCLGTGNSVANYIPLDSYLAMLDEGRKFVMTSSE